MNSIVKNKILVSVLCVFLIVIDQVTKIMAINSLMNKEDIPIIKNVLELHFLKNTGAAWGMFPNATLFFVIMTVVVCVGIVYVYFKIPNEEKYIPIKIISIFIFSGAIGNLIDRVFRKYVVDFIYFKIIDFPVFNVADIYVSVSGVVLILLMFTIYKNDEFDFLSNKTNKNG